MSKLNTDAIKKEFRKKFVDMGGLSFYPDTDAFRVWGWIDQALQQAYRKGRKDELSDLKKDINGIEGFIIQQGVRGEVRKGDQLLKKSTILSLLDKKAGKE